METRDYRTIAIIALCIGIIALSLAFCAMSTTVYIKGMDKYVGNEWNIHFNNNDNGVATGTASKGQIKLRGTMIKISDIVLNNPGDTIVYHFDIVNSGKLDAQLETIHNWSPIFHATTYEGIKDISVVRENIEYILTYDDGTPVKKGDELGAGKTRGLKLTINYTGDIRTSAKNEVKVDKLGTTLVYKQKN